MGIRDSLSIRVVVKLPTIAEVLQPSLLPKRPSLLQDLLLLKSSPFAG